MSIYHMLKLCKYNIIINRKKWSLLNVKRGNQCLHKWLHGQECLQLLQILGSHHIHKACPQSLTAVSRDSMPSLGSQVVHAHAVHLCMQANTHTYKIKKLSFKKRKLKKSQRSQNICAEFPLRKYYKTKISTSYKID